MLLCCAFQIKIIFMSRKLALKNWLKQIYKNNIKIKPASNDASFRQYYRTIIDNENYIIMDAPPPQENIMPFLNVGKTLFDDGLNTPKIYHFDKKLGFIVMADLGDDLYLSLLPQKADILYKDAIRSLVLMQNCAINNLAKYDEKLLLSEMELFIDWYLQRHLKLKLSSSQLKIINETFSILTGNALEQPQVFTHRDYHSRNLLKTKINNPGIIDFQDAVCGAHSYDLVSLLKDCYVSYSRPQIIKWVEYFLKLKNSKIEIDDFVLNFDLMGMQRHLKAIGIFARLNYRDNKPDYLKDIPRTLNYIKETSKTYPQLKDFYNLLDDLKI